MTTNPKVSKARAGSANTTGGSKSDAEFQKIIDLFASDRAVEYGGSKGFGSKALKVNGKMFAMIASNGNFVIKLPAARVDELVHSGTGEYFDPGHGRLMKQWLAMSGKSSLWLALAKEARDFVGGGR